MRRPVLNFFQIALLVMLLVAAALRFGHRDHALRDSWR